MSVKTVPLHVRMEGQTRFENITASVEAAVSGSGLHNGLVTVFAKHTTASVLIVEDEPGVRADTKALWEQLVPAHPHWQHNQRNPGEDNAHSHLRGQLQGPSTIIPFSGGKLLLGTWQQIVLLDFDTRARQRELVIQILGE
ncbi:hypothetical protein YTPLAS18_08580 [Nitrospira sp.]|nr:hypothetical protein YTPLAS18_08580 [Nitrospira sp.]